MLNYIEADINKTRLWFFQGHICRVSNTDCIHEELVVWEVSLGKEMTTWKNLYNAFRPLKELHQTKENKTSHTIVSTVSLSYVTSLRFIGIYISYSLITVGERIFRYFFLRKRTGTMLGI